MRVISFVLFAACASSPPPPASPPVSTPPPAPVAAAPVFDAMKPIMGHWRGDDPAKKSTGEYTLEPAVGGKILVRHNTNDGPEGHHEDLMIVFATPAGLRASYWDNEGHTINYAVEAAADHVEMLSDEVANMPRFKLRYDVHGPDELGIDFSIAMPGQAEMKHYTGGVVHRVR
jgi:hypothetical protein